MIELRPGDPRYPVLLGAIPAPPALFARGALSDDDALALAIVGSRRPTPYGLAVAERLASELAARGVTIVSGLARGIDTAAHRGALAAGGRTLAVLGCGLDVVYPLENRALARAIETQGALVSQFALGVPALPGHFPARNRTLAGLALGVVVVEAADRSGALITAGFAGDLGREVFARTVLNSLHAGRTSCQNYQNRGAAPCAGRWRRRASSDNSRTGVTRAECSGCWLQTSRSTSSSSSRARGSIPRGPRRCS